MLLQVLSPDLLLGLTVLDIAARNGILLISHFQHLVVLGSIPGHGSNIPWPW